MLDLNTLIAPGSGLQLTRAININDRGEILAAADPLGVTPIDDADLGHLVLLVPCDADKNEACGDNVESTNNVAQRSPALVNSPTTSPQRRLTPKESVAAWRTQMMRRYHFAALGTPKD